MTENYIGKTTLGQQAGEVGWLSREEWEKTLRGEGRWTDAGTGSGFTVTSDGFKELEAVLRQFDNEYNEAAKDIITKITQEGLKVVKPRSPYLYGILRGAHLAQFGGSGANFEGVIGIHPATVHPILGGRPSVYGLRLHNAGRPWFAQSFWQDLPAIVKEYGAGLGELYLNISKAKYIHPRALWDKWW